jgi:hypothetical protein
MSTVSISKAKVTKSALLVSQTQLLGHKKTRMVAQVDISISKHKRPKVIISSILELESMLVVDMDKEMDSVELVETFTMMVPFHWDQEQLTSMVDSEALARITPYQKDVVMEHLA